MQLDVPAPDLAALDRGEAQHYDDRGDDVEEADGGDEGLGHLVDGSLVELPVADL